MKMQNQRLLRILTRSGFGIRRGVTFGQRMKNILMTAVVAMCAMVVLAQERLNGTWRCVEMTNGQTRTATWTFAKSNAVFVTVEYRPRESPRGYILDEKWRGSYELSNEALTLNLRDATAYVSSLPPRTNTYIFCVSNETLFVTTENGRTRKFLKDGGPNHTSDGIRQPADGSPKPSR